MKTAAPVKTSKLLTVLLALTTAVALLTGSIAVPILYRPFYYLQIGPLELEERTGLSEEEIRTAFDEVLDYCTGRTEEFSTGVLAWSESGRDHFTDVRGLFLLDLQVLVESVLHRGDHLHHPRGAHHPAAGRAACQTEIGQAAWPRSRLLGGSRAGGGVPGDRRPGRPGLQPGLHRVSHHLLPRQGQLAL